MSPTQRPPGPLFPRLPGGGIGGRPTPREGSDSGGGAGIGADAFALPLTQFIINPDNSISEVTAGPSISDQLLDFGGVAGPPIIGSYSNPVVAGLVNDNIFALRTFVVGGKYKGLRLPIYNGGTNNTSVLQSMGGTVEVGVYNSDASVLLKTSGAVAWPAAIYLPAYIEVDFTSSVTLADGIYALVVMGRLNADAIVPLHIGWTNNADQAWNQMLGDFGDPARVLANDHARFVRCASLLQSAKSPTAYTALPANWRDTVGGSAPNNGTCVTGQPPVFSLVPA